MTREFEMQDDGPVEYSECSDICKVGICESVDQTMVSAPIAAPQSELPVFGDGDYFSSVPVRNCASSPVVLQGVSAQLQDSLQKLSMSGLTQLCQRLRMQLLQQRLPLLCVQCSPRLRQAIEQTDLNLTMMLRSLCFNCRVLFNGSNSLPAMVFSNTSSSACDSQESASSLSFSEDAGTDSISRDLSSRRSIGGSSHPSSICASPIKRKRRIMVSLAEKDEHEFDDESSFDSGSASRNGSSIVLLPTPSTTPAPGRISKTPSSSLLGAANITVSAAQPGKISRIILRPPSAPPSASVLEQSVSDKAASVAARKKKRRNKKNTPLLRATDLPIYAALTDAGLDWCRLCGWFSDPIVSNNLKEDSSVSKNAQGQQENLWQAGPWGPRSFCARHAIPPSLMDTMKAPSSDRRLPERIRPILQDYCAHCRQLVFTPKPSVASAATGAVDASSSSTSSSTNTLENNKPSSQPAAAEPKKIPFVVCFGCPRAQHIACLKHSKTALLPASARGARKRWFCSAMCYHRHAAAASAAMEYQQKQLHLLSSDTEEEEHHHQLADSAASRTNKATLSRSHQSSKKNLKCKGTAGSVPSIIMPSSASGTRRYAKVLGTPPTPPSSPGRFHHKKSNRKRKSSHSFSSQSQNHHSHQGGEHHVGDADILVCFESSSGTLPSNLAKVRAADVVFTPSFELVALYPPSNALESKRPRLSNHDDETVKMEEELLALDERIMARRHARYEEVEKTMRLCRPEVLKSLHASAESVTVLEEQISQDQPASLLISCHETAAISPRKDCRIEESSSSNSMNSNVSATATSSTAPPPFINKNMRCAPSEECCAA